MSQAGQERARALAGELAALGVLDPAWREAFEQVPRHVFVPRFYRPDGVLVDSADPDTREEWLDTVYRDDSLLTQRLAEPGSGRIVPTSSSTRPSLMALMLGRLEVSDGHAVLEIGTGTGYNAALLAHRLGDDHVTSIDIDPDLIEQPESPRRGPLPRHAGLLHVAAPPDRRSAAGRAGEQLRLRPDHKPTHQHLARSHPAHRPRPGPHGSDSPSPSKTANRSGSTTPTATRYGFSQAGTRSPARVTES